MRPRSWKSAFKRSAQGVDRGSSSFDALCQKGCLEPFNLFKSELSQPAKPLVNKATNEEKHWAWEPPWHSRPLLALK